MFLDFRFMIRFLLFDIFQNDAFEYICSINNLLRSNSWQIKNQLSYLKMSSQDDSYLKIFVLGATGVGKCSLLLSKDQFGYGAIGALFETKFVNVDGNHVKLHIYLEARQEKYRTIPRALYRGAHGILAIFDLSNRDTFTQMRLWIESIKISPGDPIDIVLLGNKSDLERAVDREEAEELAAQYQIKYFETSALYENNIDKVLTYLATEAYHRRNSAPL